MTSASSGNNKSSGIAHSISRASRTAVSLGLHSARCSKAQSHIASLANCSACHAGSNFTDNGFHNIGVGIDLAEPDVGRQSISKLSGDRGSFKTPTLRDIDRTAPYMHDGSMATLEDVIEHYSNGGIDNPQLDEEIFKLDLTDQEKKDLVLFLKEGLASQNYPMVEVPTLPE